MSVCKASDNNTYTKQLSECNNINCGKVINMKK